MGTKTIIDAETRLDECYLKLKEEFKTRKNEIAKSGRSIDAEKSQSNKIILLKMGIGTAFLHSYELSKEVLRLMGGPLAVIERLEKSQARSFDERLKIEAKMKMVQSQNIELKRELSAVIKKLKEFERRIRWLESRPPGGGGGRQAAARVPIRQS
jgi:hypothetical protein